MSIEQIKSSLDDLSRTAAATDMATASAHAQAAEAMTVMSNLANASDRIGNASAIVRTLADQTNLLALNATIESARAGAAGRRPPLASPARSPTSQVTAPVGGSLGR